MAKSTTVISATTRMEGAELIIEWYVVDEKLEVTTPIMPPRVMVSRVVASSAHFMGPRATSSSEYG